MLLRQRRKPGEAQEPVWPNDKPYSDTVTARQETDGSALAELDARQGPMELPGRRHEVMSELPGSRQDLHTASEDC